MRSSKNIQYVANAGDYIDNLIFYFDEDDYTYTKIIVWMSVKQKTQRKYTVIDILNNRFYGMIKYRKYETYPLNSWNHSSFIILCENNLLKNDSNWGILIET